MEPRRVRYVNNKVEVSPAGSTVANPIGEDLFVSEPDTNANLLIPIPPYAFSIQEINNYFNQKKTLLGLHPVGFTQSDLSTIAARCKNKALIEYINVQAGVEPIVEPISLLSSTGVLAQSLGGPNPKGSTEPPPTKKPQQPDPDNDLYAHRSFLGEVKSVVSSSEARKAERRAIRSLSDDRLTQGNSSMEELLKPNPADIRTPQLKLMSVGQLDDAEKYIKSTFDTNPIVDTFKKMRQAASIFGGPLELLKVSFGMAKAIVTGKTIEQGKKIRTENILNPHHDKEKMIIGNLDRIVRPNIGTTTYQYSKAERGFAYYVMAQIYKRTTYNSVISEKGRNEAAKMEAAMLLDAAKLGDPVAKYELGKVWAKSKVSDTQQKGVDILKSLILNTSKDTRTQNVVAKANKLLQALEEAKPAPHRSSP